MRLKVADATIFAYTGGRAPTPERPLLLFVHGAAHDHSVWALQSRYFAHHGRNVLVPDLPGHGRSGGAALASVPLIANWLIALLDAAGEGAATLVGHSLGALAALDCAARYPDRVERLALLGPAVPMVVSEELATAARDDEHLAYEMVNGWSFGPARQLGASAAPGFWITGNAMRLMERNRPGVLATDLAACASYAGGLDAASVVRCPTLVLLGGRDLMAPAKAAAELVARLRDPHVVSLATAGHSLMAEEPDAVLDALRGFVDGAPRSTTAAAASTAVRQPPSPLS